MDYTPPDLAFYPTIAANQTLSGSYTWRAVTSDASGIDRVEFFIDGTFRWKERGAPYDFFGDGARFDTTSWSNGAHRLKMRSYDKAGNMTEKSIAVTIKNDLHPVLVASGRDRWKWPFSAESIWNMPLGASAVLKPAGLGAAGAYRTDTDLLFQLKAPDPTTTVDLPQSWGTRCGGTSDTGLRVNFPRDLVVPDASGSSTPNNATAMLQPGSQQFLQFNALARCVTGGPVFGTPRAGEMSIYGSGEPGGHGGSGLSSIGGTIRIGELTGTAPIHHALKLNLWAKKYLFYGTSKVGGTVGYRWPARNHDGYYSATSYGGTNPEMMMGSLLALPPALDISTIGLETAPGRKIAKALQQYGTYVVDDTTWDAYAFSMEAGVGDEVKSQLGVTMNGTGAFMRDVNRLASRLQVVTDSSPGNVGGAGTRLAPMAPPFAN